MISNNFLINNNCIILKTLKNSGFYPEKPVKVREYMKRAKAWLLCFNGIKFNIIFYFKLIFHTVFNLIINYLINYFN